MDADTRATLNRMTTWVLAGVLALSVLGVIYVATNPAETTDPYTEFYALGPDGNASAYPTDLTAGGSGTVVIGISNHEGTTVRYRVVVTWNGSRTTTRSVRVPDATTREIDLPLRAPSDPGRYRVRFLLYKSGTTDGEPYRWLRLWIRVHAQT